MVPYCQPRSSADKTDAAVADGARADKEAKYPELLEVATTPFSHNLATHQLSSTSKHTIVDQVIAFCSFNHGQNGQFQIFTLRLGNEWRPPTSNLDGKLYKSFLDKCQVWK